ncbi:hypothetical protein TEA_016551 [Camellia sinensis var. sinensis]|uniref:Vps53 N-terminal domain-containing protein n=1 Tax=Camellia sinensis var. sinensis TaxID=542762 RepID=A0A4V3WJN5_CAMSN|nr:hypothetical protein TEA_016551 [Camellia sinensis var. sinensis]
MHKDLRSNLDLNCIHGDWAQAKNEVVARCSGHHCKMALQRTLEFEEELAEKFGDSTHGRETGNDNEETGRGGNNSQTVSDIRKKYEKKLAAHQGSESEEKDRQKDLVPGAGFNFHGIVSSCFEPHLTVYVELEERTLMENLEKLVQEETWDIEEGNQTNILPSLSDYPEKLEAMQCIDKEPDIVEFIQGKTSFKLSLLV